MTPSAPPELEWYIITRDGPAAPVMWTNYRTRDKFIEAVRDYYRNAMSGDKGVSQSIWMFEGRRISLRGDPLRALVFPDGTRSPVFENNADAADETRLFPPSMRIKTLPVKS